MKITKVNKDKLKVILSLKDTYSILDGKDTYTSIDLLTNDSFTSVNTNKVLYYILVKAKKDFSFDTTGCKLLIEQAFISEEFFTFIITKLNGSNSIQSNISKDIKFKKDRNLNIFGFKSFDSFLDLINLIKKEYPNLDIKTLLYTFKSFKLVSINNLYFLIMQKNANINDSFYNLFFETVTKVSTSLSFTKLFYSKFLEHSKIVISKKDIINFFINSF